MLKSFISGDREYTPHQDLADFQVWRCEGNQFVVPFKKPTRAQVKAAYDEFKEKIDQRK